MSLKSLLSAAAVRNRCNAIGAAATTGETKWFRYVPTRLSDCIEIVANECLANYPDLNIPYHSRWRHFTVGDVDLWQHYVQQKLGDVDAKGRTRSAIDLVFVSVLLDAGAGDNWRYIDPVTGVCLERSEGLAAASIDLFFNHIARFEPEHGFVVDSKAILDCSVKTIENAFQHTNENPLLGVEGRVQLLHGLANTLGQLSSQGITRPGNIYDLLLLESEDESIAAGDVLEIFLELFNGMWPSGLVQDAIHLGDCGRHQLLQCDDETNGLVPFHKLSQWLTYSLLEPLQWAGLEVTGLDQLTGLPEYRNGGLLLDTGVLVPVDPDLNGQRLLIDSESVVEWRALTVWLLDEIAAGVRDKFGMTADQLPLASVLQGGTWSAGRKLAREKRSGKPPLNLAIDGTIF